MDYILEPVESGNDDVYSTPPLCGLICINDPCGVDLPLG